jgi:hypothetical protein
MTFPQEDDLAPRFGRMAARRAGGMAAGMQFLAFLRTRGPGPVDWSSEGVFASVTYRIPAGSFGERKAQADEIASRVGATPSWRNGYYIAVRHDAVLRTEIYFLPPIRAAEAEDAA